MILVVGDSFLCPPRMNELLAQRFNTTETILNISHPGAGNQYIAGVVEDMLALHKDDISYVFILCSGVNRYDYPVSIELAETLDLSSYSISQHSISNRKWISTGGMIFPGRKSSDIINKIFNLHYSTSTSHSLTIDYNRELYRMEMLLKAYNITYDMGSIYDTTKSPEKQEHCLGNIDTTIPKNHILSLTTYPYNYCLEHDKLSGDNFHPTYFGFQDWINSVKLKID